MIFQKMMAEAPEGAESEVTSGRKEAGALSASEVISVSGCMLHVRLHPAVTNFVFTL